MSLVVFDCDGVLVDSEPIAARVTSDLLADLGVPLSPTEVRERYMGCSDEFFRRDIERQIGRPLPGSWSTAADAALDAAFAAELRPVPGVHLAIEAAIARGWSICVASNGSPAKVERSLRLTGLWERFAGKVFSAHHVCRGKPAPDVFLHAATVMGFSPDDCVVVEDSDPGLRAALSAGMKPILFAPDMADDAPINAVVLRSMSGLGDALDSVVLRWIFAKGGSSTQSS